MPLWPLLLYLATAFSLAWGARRLCRALGHREILILVAVPLVFVGPALVTGRTLSPIDRAYSAPPLADHRALLADRPPSSGVLHDPFAQSLPWRAATRHAFRIGEWPLWNPFSRAGEPLAGFGQAAPYSPINLAALLVELPDEAAYVGGVVLVTAGLGAFLFLSSLEFSATAALVGAAGWTMSGFSLFWLPWPLAQPVALLPFTLFATIRLARAPDLSRAALLAFALTWLLLTGHQESVAHVVLASALGAAAALPWRSPRSVATSCALALGSVATALALTAFFVLPHLDAIDQSAQAAQRLNARDRSFHRQPIERVRATLRLELVPFAWGTTNEEIATAMERLGPVRRAEGWLPGRAFGGGALLALAAAAPFAPRRRFVRTGLLLYLFGVFAGAGFGPIHALLARIPIVGLALNSRLVFLGALGLALLATTSVEGWIEAPPRRRALIGGAVAASGVVLALVALACWPDARGVGVAATSFAVRTAWLALPAAIIGWRLAARAGRPDGVLAIALLMLITERRAETEVLFRPQERAAFLPRVAPLDSLPVDDEPSRAAGLGYLLAPNVSALYEFEDPRGESPLALRRLAELHRAFDPTVPKWFPHRDLYFDADDPRLRLFNARYIFTDSDAAVPSRYRTIAQGGGLELHVDASALPRAFVPSEVIVGAAGRTLVGELASIERLGDTATIEPVTPSSSLSPGRQPNGAGTVSTRRDGLGLRLETDLTTESWIVVSESHWRGWRARVGEVELPLAYADHALLGLLAPAGRHEIELRYRPRSFVAGARVSATAALVLAAAGLGLVLRRRIGRA